MALSSSMPGRRGRRVLASIFIASLSWSSVAAQQLLNFGSGALPACAEQCQLLTEAQTACVPPAAPVTDQATYLSCFCQSGYLTTLKTDATNVCGTVCQGTDLTQISIWYSSVCAADAPAAAAAPATTTTTQAAAGAGVATQTTTASASTSSSQTSQSGSSTKKSSGHQSWWSTHWKWVLMLILVAGVLGLIALIAVLLRRRHRRKRDRMSGRFNDGITARSMVSIGPNVQSPTMSQHPYAAHGRHTPSMTDVNGGARGGSVSSFTLSRARGDRRDSSGGDAARPMSTGSKSGIRTGTPQPVEEGHGARGRPGPRISEEDLRE
ncbi:hypothetical protein ANO11243_043370 [Dothideomycetidae sp. 11243]|nr:hypothetical protein ANO11243_043370 [fungal sp. No.11243]